MQQNQSVLILEKTGSRPKKPVLKRTDISRKCSNFGTVKELKKLEHKYDDFVPLYEMWKEYFADLFLDSLKDSDEVVVLKNPENLLKADYHGCLLCVTHSTNSTHIGISGIVVRESKHTLILATRRNRFVVIPKKGAVFEFVWEKRLFRIHGDNFVTSGTMRQQKKFKYASVTRLSL